MTVSQLNTDLSVVPVGRSVVIAIVFEILLVSDRLAPMIQTYLVICKTNRAVATVE